MIDDELVITVRVRIPRDFPDDSQTELAWKVGKAVTARLDSGTRLSGVEIALPTFEPYPNQPSEPTPTSA